MCCGKGVCGVDDAAKVDVCDRREAIVSGGGVARFEVAGLGETLEITTSRAAANACRMTMASLNQSAASTTNTWLRGVVVVAE